MNIDAASLSQIQQADVQNQISIKVARKTLDAEQQQGDAAIALIKAAAEVAKQTGAGGKLDVQG
ncbi:MAG: putative motility protein [Tepidisphaera sp.]|nr:putative motility protein [Tepidisphaera sp.]